MLILLLFLTLPLASIFPPSIKMIVLASLHIFPYMIENTIPTNQEAERIRNELIYMLPSSTIPSIDSKESYLRYSCENIELNLMPSMDLSLHVFEHYIGLEHGRICPVRLKSLPLLHQHLLGKQLDDNCLAGMTSTFNDFYHINAKLCVLDFSYDEHYFNRTIMLLDPTRPVKLSDETSAGYDDSSITGWPIELASIVIYLDNLKDSVTEQYRKLAKEVYGKDVLTDATVAEQVIESVVPFGSILATNKINSIITAQETGFLATMMMDISRNLQMRNKMKRQNYCERILAHVLDLQLLGNNSTILFGRVHPMNRMNPLSNTFDMKIADVVEFVI